ncbi:hypothetical protein EV193_103227 [Herbihabitans rhizosphaerae]|uniref:VOC domain-containing protein n=1 Tax=Herbihabitans rhizosphaerae TaxID=1872711 RepID=A0A4Q7KZ03_9PSEU|nr:VOC family protein [Herbihabitans rhizosphaerae]RZS40912.1 hypothetical protein EV193_103227 [Herbihabitans rhizosphaerae]
MPGQPSHFEIGVADAGRAKAFYGKLFGWTHHPMGEGDAGWIETGGVRGGLHGDDPNPGVMLYFTVEDIEAAARTVAELGGTVGRISPEEPDFGRFAECADDQGARFGLRQPV